MTATRKPTLVLTEDTYATGIHGVTGQAIDEGWLPTGTLIRNLREAGEGFGGPIYRFDASTDGGDHWYTQECRSKPETAPQS